MSQTVTATSNCELVRANCQEALAEAEDVIKKQDELINLMQTRFMEISDDNMRMQEQMANADITIERYKQSRYVFGSAALVIGLVTGFVLGGR